MCNQSKDTENPKRDAFWKYLVRISAGTWATPTKVLREFRQCLQAKPGEEPSNKASHALFSHRFTQLFFFYIFLKDLLHRKSVRYTGSQNYKIVPLTNLP